MGRGADVSQLARSTILKWASVQGDESNGRCRESTTCRHGEAAQLVAAASPEAYVPAQLSFAVWVSKSQEQGFALLFKQLSLAAQWTPRNEQVDAHPAQVRLPPPAGLGLRVQAKARCLAALRVDILGRSPCPARLGPQRL